MNSLILIHVSFVGIYAIYCMKIYIFIYVNVYVSPNSKFLLNKMLVNLLDTVKLGLGGH